MAAATRLGCGARRSDLPTVSHPVLLLAPEAHHGESQRVHRRNDPRLDLARFRLPCEPIQGDRQIVAEGAAAGPPQRCQVSAAAELRSQIGRQRAHIGPGRAIDLDLDLGQRELDQYDPVDVDPLRGTLHLSALTRQSVERNPTHFHGAVHGRDLLDVAHEAHEDLADLLFARQRSFVPPHDLAVGVQGVGLLPQSDRAGIALGTALEEGHELRSVAHRQRQDPGRQGIQRSQVADASGSQHLAYSVDHIVGGQTLGLVHHQESGRARSFGPAVSTSSAHPRFPVATRGFRCPVPAMDHGKNAARAPA